jgi:rhodanese-related sulfurtransferase
MKSMKKKNVVFAGMLMTITLLLTACGRSSAFLSTISPTDFLKKITDRSIVLLDVRTPAEFSAGPIDGAKDLNFESPTFASDLQKLDKTKTYAVYCRSGNRSGQATALMAKNGFTSIYNLDGGIINWQSANLPLVTQ